MSDHPVLPSLRSLETVGGALKDASGNMWGRPADLGERGSIILADSSSRSTDYGLVDP